MIHEAGHVGVMLSPIQIESGNVDAYRLGS